MYEKKFINKCFKNLEKKTNFYRYYKEKKSYQDLKNFYYKFKNKISKERKKIVTFSDKSFEMYATVISIFLTNNIWVPLSLSLPVNRLISILKASDVNIIVCDKDLEILKNTKFNKYVKKIKSKFFHMIILTII